MTCGEVLQESCTSYIENLYKNKIYDENIPPVLLEKDGVIKKEDTIFFFNYRADRMKQIFMRCAKNNSKLYTLTKYDDGFKCKIVINDELVVNTLAETISKVGLALSHIADTEKYAHLTYFLNGGREKPFKNENHYLIDSPDVSSFDLKPEMSLYQIVERCFLEMKNFPFIVMNFANPDMVGHTGNFDATCEAILCTDEAIGLVYEGCIENGYSLVITSDHGNAEMMEDDKGNVITKHTNSMVSFIICDEPSGDGTKEWVFKGKGTLSDVAPTILEMLEIEMPAEVTGKSFFKKS